LIQSSESSVVSAGGVVLASGTSPFWIDPVLIVEGMVICSGQRGTLAREWAKR
jgi:hypothetical protein